MGKKNIEKYDVFYQLLKKYVDFWHNYIFYRKVIALGKDNIDFSVPTILAPNHQNALMDAMAVICTLNRQLVFLARADIFRKKVVARILYFLKILPVYRIRDGFDAVRQNDETFRDTMRVMENRNGVVILPEGNHATYRKLRQLKKGICRIAFQTAEASGFSKEINIVPVGLEYSHYWRFRQVLTVVYGHPIHVSEYYESYRANPNRAIVELRDRLSDEMKKVMVHIEDEENYDAINELRSIVNEKYSDRIRYPKLFRDQRLINKVNELRTADPESYSELCNESMTVKSLATQLKVTYRHLRKKKHSPGWLFLSALLLLASLPVFIAGAALNILTFQVAYLQAIKSKDPAFISTARYGFFLGLSFIFGPLYLILALIFIKPWWLAILAFMMIPVLGILAWNWFLLFIRTVGGLRIWNLKRKGNPLFRKLHSTYGNLVRRVSSF
ncbi:MAG TPA: 1-acyl-sn-glycerol-3-phosphate acyltransferase [Bacteroidales bacterium]|nr:1-acyl-sn-glycerol-3-phosphate acyltransferase [Bacteroidales bacterium]HPE22187.1 1-acyl-sn-glycerol-3-phosphate acyltransferase [Bacteroidales bacterium]HPJ05871.1 1-acyl-sn-glycerol-3-phosphate acyltransferase [Bacteroidales bacterium]HPQ63082.1 1-acyl-sn-glycerol-3-phosphate acyltransferase [Bacteroidales bacterium]HRW26451.1 1-acyl-sn-glycerol-3-phosphate acyltransferase [Bacteroidales bacterium]